MSGAGWVLALSVAVALALCLVTRRASYATAVRWFGLLLVLQAAGLQLVDAGPRLHYQHLRWPGSGSVRWVSSGIIVVAALFVLGFGRWSGLAVGWRRAFGSWRGVLMAAVALGLSAAPSRDLGAYAQEVAASAALQFLALGVLLNVAAAVPVAALERARHRVDAWLGPPGQGSMPRTDRVVLLSAVWVTLVCTVLAATVYQRHPHVQDEVKYLLQARYFARGLLALPTPPVPEAFRMYLFDIGPRGWYSVVPPGWPALLAVGEVFRAGWLVNPLLNGVNVLLLAAVITRLRDSRTARLAVVFLALSPWYVFLGIGFMSHAVTLTLGLLAVLGVQKVREQRSWWWLVLGGVCLGWMTIVRQLDGMITALACGLWSIGLGGRRIPIPAVTVLVVATAATVALVMPYNAWFSGHPTAFPIMEYHDRLYHVNANAYGFGPDRGMGWEMDPYPGHSPRDAMVNAALNGAAMNVELFGWALGSLIPAAFLVFSARLKRDDAPLLAVIALTFIAYFFNYYSGGPDFGARYWYLMLVPLLLLTLRGLDAMGHVALEAGMPTGPARVDAAALALMISAWLTFVPWRAVDKYPGYLYSRPAARGIAKDPSMRDALVIVRGPEFPDYAATAAYNPVPLDAGGPIFAHHTTDSASSAVIASYPNRRVFVMQRDSLAGEMRLVAGPLSGRDAEAILHRK